MANPSARACRSGRVESSTPLETLCVGAYPRRPWTRTGRRCIVLGRNVTLGASTTGRGMDRTRLVGRGSELALLREQLDSARHGAARIVFVRGEAGIGKTALVRALLSEAPDFAVLDAAGEETETSLSLGVVDQLLGRTDRRELTAGGALAAGADLVAKV